MSFARGFSPLRKTIAPEAAGPELPQGVFAFQASLFRGGHLT